MVVLAYFLIVLGLPLAFLPWGWGMITAGTGTCSFILAHTANQKEKSSAGTLAKRISVIPFQLFVLYMIVLIPTQTFTRNTQAVVVSTGELVSPHSFSESQLSDRPIEGIVLNMDSCSAQLIFRTTPLRDPHLDVDIPSIELRNCLASLKAKEKLEVEVEIEHRWLSRAVKSFSFSRIGKCTFTEHDRMAIISSGFCESWAP